MLKIFVLIGFILLLVIALWTTFDLYRKAKKRGERVMYVVQMLSLGLIGVGFLYAVFTGQTTL